MSPDQVELVRDALGGEAARLEARARSIEGDAGAHHLQRANAMRTLCADLHELLGKLADDDMVDVALLSPAERADLGAHLRGREESATGAVYEAPAHGWTCFHCGETFQTVWGARMHFGTPETSRPLCVTDPAAAAIARRRSA